jgi:zinc-binding alcohol dehydrogenase/oxidoreductase
MGSTMGSAEDFRRMLAAAATARFKPVIDSVVSIDNAVEAMRKMETGAHFGKIVLRIAD